MKTSLLDYEIMMHSIRCLERIKDLRGYQDFYVYLRSKGICRRTSLYLMINLFFGRVLVSPKIESIEDEDESL